MEASRWKQIEDIFQDALDLSGDEREKYIAEKTGDDAELRAEVEKLVVRFEEEDEFLESPVWTDSVILGNTLKNRVASSLENEILPESSDKSFTGKRVGVYRLTDQIGKGGMGVVYAAERADGEFSQKTAVKLIKRGMDTDFIVSRFRHERQILANLNHPNIARLIDGGTTDDDLPYFVMEFIDGKPLLKYAQEKNLDLRQKLKLFLQVCAPLIYAHKRKIIHRDIKPSNILVNEDGEPKLLDFGIAKLLDTDSIHESFLPTATAMRLMTPEYASPEQVRGEEITPASDQYSLGVLLYELITETRPYKFPSRSPHEIARVICEEIPSEPSSGSFGKLITGKVNVRFDEDFCKKLDRIVLKSLRKERSERYATVEEFAADIERFLRNENVRAESFTGDLTSFNKTRKNLSAPVVDQKAIAVLPFKTLNTVPEIENTNEEFLGIGLADALITRLSRVSRFVVRPTNSILPYGDRNTDSFSAGEELNVQFVVDGGIIKTGKQIRVSIQLLDVAGRSTVWAERFDEELTDVLELEDSISNRVVESLVPQLSASEVQKLAKRATDNPEAYEAYLRGRFHGNNFTEEGFQRSIKYYREAVELDPNYAQAYAAIADHYNWLGMSGLMPTEEFYPAAIEAASRAVELDPNSSEARAALGLAQLYGRYDWQASEENMLRAIELNPNNSVAHLWYVHNLYTRGDFAAGRKHIRRALELDPTSFQNNNTEAWSFYYNRQPAEAVAKADDLIEKFPAAGYSYFGKSTFLRLQGRTEESLKNSFRAIELSDDALFKFYGHAAALAAAGKREEALEIINNPPAHYSSAYHTAIVYSFLNDKEKTFEKLEQAAGKRESTMIWLAVEPTFDLLRDDSRYFVLLERINHPVLQTIYKKSAERLTPVKNTGKQSASTGSDAKSIAVLPFKILETQTTDAETDDSGFLGVGLADALITRLSNVRQFLVRPTGSILSYGDRAIDSFAAGAELKVQFVLDGSIIKTDKRIRVSVQLLNVAEQITVWADRFDEDLTDVLTLEDSISRRIADFLVPQMSGEEHRRLEKRGTEIADAYEAYLRGRYHWNLFSEEGFRQAIGFYEKAVAHDPNYAAAHASIAEYYVWRGIYGALPPTRAYEAAKRAAHRAIELDPNNAEAYAALGMAQIYADYDWRQGEQNMTRALELNETNATTHLWRAYPLLATSRFDEGIRHLKRAIELDPTSFASQVLAYAYYFARRFDDALDESRRILAQIPGNAYVYALQTSAYRLLGKRAEALAAAQRVVESSNGSPFFAAVYAQTLAATGNRAEAERIAAQLEERSRTTDEYISFYLIAVIYCFLGDKERAFAALDRAFAMRDGLLVWIDVEHSFDALLRDDPRFGELLRKINFPNVSKNSAQKSIADSAAKEITGDHTTATTKITAPRRNGIKQGAFLIIVSFLLLPVLVMSIAAFDFFSPEHLFVVFLLVFGGGLVRILYAFFFESKSALAADDSTSAFDGSFSPLPTQKSNETEMNAKNAAPANIIKRHWLQWSFYVLVTISLLSFGYLVYHVIKNIEVNLGDSSDRRWRDNFAATMTVRRLTTSGRASNAALAPGGNMVAYVVAENERQSLWQSPVETGEPKQIVPLETVVYHSVTFSPDGEEIYYTASPTTALGTAALYRVAVAGGEPQKVSDQIAAEVGFAPDGGRVAYFRFDPKTRVRSLCVAEFDGAKNLQPPVEVTTLKFPAYAYGTPAFSPDGTKIAFVSSTDSDLDRTANINVFDLRTRETQTLSTGKSFYISSVKWRMNGEEIVFAANRTRRDPSQLWLVNYPTGEIFKLTNDLSNYDGVSLSNDFKSLVTTKSETTRNIVRANLDAAPNAPTMVKEITESRDRQDGLKGLQWSAQNKILFIGGTTSENILTQTDADGANSRIINPGENFLPISPLLTSDGKFLIFVNEKDDEWELWRRETATGAMQKIAGVNALAPALTPDDRFIIYSAERDAEKRLTLRRIAIEGGDEIELTSDFAVRPAVSPDGRFIVCYYNGAATGNRWEIAVLNMNGGVPVRIIKPPDTLNLQTPFERPLGWSADGKFIFYLNDKGGSSNIFRVPADGSGSPASITHFTSGRIFDFSVAPDGQNAVLSRGSTSSDIVVFKNSR